MKNMLRHITERALPGMSVCSRYFYAVNTQSSRLGLQKSEDDVHGGRFARTRSTHQANCGLRKDFEAQVLNGRTFGVGVGIRGVV